VKVDTLSTGTLSTPSGNLLKGTVRMFTVDTLLLFRGLTVWMSQ
jgi:hypothetical protein